MSRWLATCLTLLVFLPPAVSGCNLSDPPRKRAVASGTTSDAQATTDATLTDVVAATPPADPLGTARSSMPRLSPVGKGALVRPRLGDPRTPTRQLRLEGTRKQVQGLRTGTLKTIERPREFQDLREPVPGQVGDAAAPQQPPAAASDEATQQLAPAAEPSPPAPNE